MFSSLPLAGLRVAARHLFEVVYGWQAVEGEDGGRL
jgi:hypothetical protein